MRYINLNWLAVVFFILNSQFLILNSHAQDSAIQGFSILPPSVSKVVVQKNSDWEELYIVLESQLSRDLVPILTDSTVELSIERAPAHSAVFQTVGSGIARGLAWSDGKFVVYLNRGQRPAVMIMKNRILLQNEIVPGKLDNWQAFSTGLKSSSYFLPSAEPLAINSADFAHSFDKKPVSEVPLLQTIQVKRSDASYIVIEEIVNLYERPAENSRYEVLEFGTRLKVLEKQRPYYKVRHQNKEGYVFQRDVLQEAELTTSQKDRLRHLKKEAPGGVDSVAAMFGWRDNEKIIYSSYGSRDPFVEVKSEGKDGIVIDNLVLAGIIFENEKPMALFSDNKIRGKSYILNEQDTIKNGKVVKIWRDSVSFLLQESGVSRRYKMILPNKYGGDK